MNPPHKFECLFQIVTVVHINECDQSSYEHVWHEEVGHYLGFSSKGDMCERIEEHDSKYVVNFIIA